MKAKIFVSYSRKDSEAARRLINSFEAMEYDVWVDWEDIPPAARWMEQIEDGIEKSDAFIFLISPDSIASVVCNVELEHAAEYNKRIIPIVLRTVKPEDTNDVIRQLNWIFIREEDDYEEGLAKFRAAMEIDFAWVSEHNRLLDNTLEWHEGNSTSLLLRGYELRRIRKVVKDAAGREPKLTELQESFLEQSIKNEKRTYLLRGVVALTIMILAGLAYYALFQRNLALENEKFANQQKDIALNNERAARTAQEDAENQRVIAEERANFALAQQNAARALMYQSQFGELYTSSLLAIASWTTAPSVEASEILRKNISLLPIPVNQVQRDGRINSLVLRVDKDLFVTGGEDGNACVWQVKDGELLFCNSSPRPVNDAIFSADGSQIITGDDSGLVQVVDVKTQNVVGTFEANSLINDLDVNPVSGQVAVTRDDGAITILDPDGVREYDLQAFGHLEVAAFSPDGKYIASGASAGSVTLWNLSSGGKPISNMQHKGEVLTLKFSPDSRYLITGGVDGYAVASLASTGDEVYRLLHEDWVTDIDYSPDSSWFATVSNDSRIRLWNITDGTERLRMAQNGFINEVKISSNGEWIATTGADKTVRVWSASTGAEIFQIPLDGEGTVIGFGADGKNLVAGDAVGGINDWDISVMPAPQSYIQFDDLAGDAQFSPSGEWFAGSDGTRAWLLKTDQLSALTMGEPLLTLGDEIIKITFSPDSGMVGFLTSGGQIVIHNLETGSQKMVHPTDISGQIAFTPDGESLVTCGANGVVEVWNLAAMEKTADLAGDGSGAISIAASPAHIAIGMSDKIEIYPSTGEPVITINSPGDHKLITFSNDGSLLASSNSGGLIEVWRNENGSYKSFQPIRKDSVYSLAFNPDGTRLAAGGMNAVYLIDPLEMEEVARVPHPDKVVGISYSMDGKVMATASLRAIQFWDVAKIADLPTDDLVAVACSRLMENFSKAQWSNLFGDEEYRILCKDLPVP